MAAARPTVVIAFKDMETDESLRESVDSRCREYAAEFPEIARLEITIAPDGAGHNAHGHVTGSNIEVATHAEAKEPGHAVDRLLDKLVRQLRKQHDKRIFAHRREAQQTQLKRRD